MSERPQYTRLKEMLIHIDDPKFPMRKLNEIFYTACETGIIDGEAPLEDVKTLYKLLQLSLTITDVELQEIRM